MLLAYEDTTNIYGVNKSSFRFNDTHTLSKHFAVGIVGDWYATSKDYDYYAEPTTSDAGIF